MQRLNQKVVLLPLAQQVYTFLVASNYHIREYFVALPFLSNLCVLNLFFAPAAHHDFFLLQFVRCYSELVIKFSASFDRLNTVVSISLDIFEQLIRSLSV